MWNKSVCSSEVNASCWRALTCRMNTERALLMSPVIIMMSTFMFIGAFGNALVLFVYYRRKHKTTNLYIVLLAAVDLFACVVIHPYIIYKLFNNYNQTWVGLCKTFEFFVHLNLGLSALILLLIAVDRYFAICRPVKFLVIDKHMHKGIVGVLALSVVISLPLFEFYGSAPDQIVLENVIVVEYKCHYKVEYQNSTALLGFSCFIMLGFLTETIAMAVLYKNVALTAYRKGRVVMPLSNAHILAGITPTNGSAQPKIRLSFASRTTSPLPTASRDFTTLESSEHSRGSLFVARSNTATNKEHAESQRSGSVGKTKKNDRTHFVTRLKAAKMLFLVTAVFFLSWLPFFVTRICYVLNQGYWGEPTDLKKVLDSGLNHFIYLSNAANPLIYTVINKNFRQDIIQVFKIWCNRQ